jgi:2'-5' RNA ligase
MMSCLYFVAIIPPKDICEAITKIKEDICERFNTKHALRLIPHITLKAPFSISTHRHQSIVTWFQDIPPVVQPFLQELNSFNCFANKNNPVIFIEPVLSSPLKLLQVSIITEFRKEFPDVPVSQNELRFHPHITVGYRDLAYENFQSAWREYRDKSFKASFKVENFSLLQHDRKQWNIIASRSLL